VRTWRKLQRLGAVAIKNSVYTLPYSDRTFEDFQWLKQEIEASGGEATVFRAAAVEGATNKEIVALFNKTRDEEYAEVTAGLNGLAGAIREQARGRHLSGSRLNAHEAELTRLHKELERITGTDFFNAPGRAAAVSAYGRCSKALRSRQNRSEEQAKSGSTGAARKIAQYQGRRWVTRRGLFIDRLASIWLIRRFIDKKPRFSFVAEGEAAQDGIGFDLYGGQFTHRGEDCTFEILLKEFGLIEDLGLREIAEIVHDIDLKDNKFNRTEAAGLSALIRGLAGWLNNDRKLIHHCNPIFDGLYELLGRSGEKPTGRANDEKRANSRNKSDKRRP